MTLDEVGDEELLHLTAGGDDAAFALFVERHQGGVWRRARSLAASEADAEDVLQETFLAAWRAAGGFRGGSARSWLLTIAGRAWQRQVRRSRVLEPVGDTETLESLALRAGWGRSETPEVGDREAIIQRAYARLSAADRRVLALRDIEDVRGEEVAALLGLSLAAMKSRLHRARLRLAAAFEEVRHESA